MQFTELQLDESILKAIHKVGYEKTTDIQSQAIPLVLKGRDVIGIAQTGTGKTAAFVLPVLQKFINDKTAGNGKLKCLILAPTRELAIQIHDNIVEYTKYMKVRSAVIFGGVKQGRQVESLKGGVDILVATPGRLDDLMKQRIVHLKDVDVLILDEADRMLDLGFVVDVERIVQRIPNKRQTLLFTATFPKEIENVANRYLSKPVTISVTPVSSTTETVEQSLYYTDKVHKVSLLVDLIKENNGDSVLVFCRTKHNVDKVVKHLKRMGITVEGLHSNKSQNARERALNALVNYKIQVLVATDIAARGIDIHELGLVINFEMPDTAEAYVHRIGRTGRAKATGRAISFSDFHEMEMVKKIEKLTQQEIPVVENHEYPLTDRTPKKPKQQQGRRGDGNKTGRGAKQEPSKRKNYSHHKPKNIDLGLDGQPKKPYRKKIFYNNNSK